MKHCFAWHPPTHLERRVTRRRAPRNIGRLAATAVLLAGLLTFAAALQAETLSGTVTNGTTGKPAAGDDVVLLTLGQGMQESGRTKTDAQGKFSFNFDSGGPHLVRVNHQGVNYFPAGGPIMPGITSTEVKVYDAAKKVDGVSENVRVMRVQADQNSLQVIELISVLNKSNPPRSLMADRTYEITIPADAAVDEGVAQGPGGMPVNSAPVPDDKTKGKFYFVFPIRPGETRFQIAYHLPYSGEATLLPKVTGKLEHLAIMLPKSMDFGARKEGVYRPVNDQNNQANLQVATQVTPGQDLAFRVSGTGMLPDEQQGAQQEAQAGGAMGGPGGRPGGGLGTPEGTPDALHKYRWAILAGCLALLAAGGGWVATRKDAAVQQQALRAAPGRATALPPLSAAAPQLQPQAPQSGLLLQALKEELFELEIERQQGRISETDYQKAKSALDQTLQRALSRGKAAV